MGKKMKIITIIPAYNESKFIKKVVKCSKKYSDVVVVDDGSDDNTGSVAENAGAVVLKHPKNLGKGAAIKTGLKFVSKEYDVVVLIDGDGQHDPSYIPHFIAAMKDVQIVIGSRFKEKFPDNMPFQRKLANKLTTRIIRYVTGYEITDSQSGFRSISADILNFFIDIKYDDYVFESEMLYTASKNNIKIKNMETNEKKEKFIQLRAKGYSFDKIAKKLQMSKQTLIDWNKELEEEISNFKAMELELLYEKYYLTREQRLQTFGQMLSRLKDEIDIRNLSEIPTEKLLELFLKYNEKVKEELIEPKFQDSNEMEQKKHFKYWGM